VAIRPITRCGTAVIEDSWKFNQRGNAKEHDGVLCRIHFYTCLCDRESSDVIRYKRRVGKRPNRIPKKNTARPRGPTGQMTSEQPVWSLSVSFVSNQIPKPSFNEPKEVRFRVLLTVSSAIHCSRFYCK
jgi:hypothetical protein